MVESEDRPAKRQKSDRFYIGDGRLQAAMDSVLESFPTRLIDLISLYEFDFITLTEYNKQWLHGIATQSDKCRRDKECPDRFPQFVDHVIYKTLITKEKLGSLALRGSVHLRIEPDSDGKNLRATYTYPLSQNDLLKMLSSNQRGSLQLWLKTNADDANNAPVLFAEYEDGFRKRGNDYGFVEAFCQTPNPPNPFPCTRCDAK